MSETADKLQWVTDKVNDRHRVPDFTRVRNDSSEGTV